jgi:hypothetical protein
LTIRQDNTEMKSTAELLPVAQWVGDRFALGAWELTPDRSTFSGREAFRPEERYYVYHRGKLLGEVLSREYQVGGYDCSGFCVLRTNAKFPVPKGVVREDRIILIQNGTVDETRFYLVALSSSKRPRVFETSVPKELLPQIRDLLTRFSGSQLATGKGPGGETRVTGTHLFRLSPHGELLVFVNAVREEENDKELTLSAILRLTEGPSADVLSLFLGNDYTDRGSPFYEFVDSIDVDGDGFAEIIAIYHHYELHEFVILGFRNGRYEIVHRGPSYGC